MKKNMGSPVLRIAVMFAILDELKDNELRARGEVVAAELLKLSNFEGDDTIADHERVGKIAEKMTHELFFALVKQLELTPEEVAGLINKKLVDAGYMLPGPHTVGRFASARL